MKKIICFLLLLLYFSTTSFAQEKSPFNLDLHKDIAISAGSLGLFATALILDYSIDKTPGSESILHYENIPAFDRWSALPYNDTIDRVSDFFSIGLLATPALLSINRDFPEIITLGIMYTEALLTTWSLKSLSKALITRHRPYNYFENPSEHFFDEESADSFFSSQTAMSFTSAAFISTVFSSYSENTLAEIIVSSSAFAAATAVGAMRLLSGSHFASDVLVGAAVGTLSGFLIPALHKNLERNSLEIALFTQENEDFSLSFKISL